MAYYEHKDDKGKNKNTASEKETSKGSKADSNGKKSNAPVGGKGNAAGKKGNSRQTKHNDEKQNNFARTLTVNNERLEFLGDAVLGAIVADILYRHYGRKQEGFLTSLRSKIVCRQSLNQLAVDLGLDRFINHIGAVTTGHNSYMNGNAFEAFFGAIYLDRGYKYCYRFLEDVVFARYINIDQVAKTEANYKSALIEWCQKYKYQFVFSQKSIPSPEGNSTPRFKSSITIEGVPCGTGEGYTKKEADQNAAKQTLSKTKRDKVLAESIRSAMHLRIQRQKEASAKAASEK